MQFMVSRRLGGVDRGVDPTYRKKKTCCYCSCIYTLSSSLSCPSFIERLLELAFVSGAQIWPILLIFQFQMEPRET